MLNSEKLFTGTDVINAIGKFSKKQGFREAFVKDDVFDTYLKLTRGGKKIGSETYLLKDGSYVNYHLGAKTGYPTLVINTGGRVYKIRNAYDIRN